MLLVCYLFFKELNELQKENKALQTYASDCKNLTDKIEKVKQEIDTMRLVYENNVLKISGKF